MLTQVDPLTRNGNRGEQRGDELVLHADQREHRAVVIRVAVDVEQARVRNDRGSDRVDRPAVAPFREVRHGFEPAHARTLGSR